MTNEECNPWIVNSTIFSSIVGSQAYGMDTEYSDVDVKGVCIPPENVRYRLFDPFEQAIHHPHIEATLTHRRNPKNPKIESTIFSLDKYLRLITETNPNTIELLFTEPQFHIKTTPVWEKLRAQRNIFITIKARHTFTGYANSQIQLIERHRRWANLTEEPKQPKRETFGIHSPKLRQKYAEAQRYIQREIEKWNLSDLRLDDAERTTLKERCWDIVSHLNQNAEINWANWPESYFQAGLIKLENRVQLDKEILKLLAAEKSYQLALKEWNSYQKWKFERNRDRFELEKKHGFDTKSASHLIRLMRMGMEIVKEGTVRVLRPDAHELLAIRQGRWTYEEVMDAAKNYEQDIKKAEKTSGLPKKTDRQAVEALYFDMIKTWNR